MRSGHSDCCTCSPVRPHDCEDERIRVECDSCPVSYQFGVPPAAFVGCRPVWRVADFDPDSQRLHGRDPLRARVTYEADGAELTVVVDGNLDVVDIRSG